MIHKIEILRKTDSLPLKIDLPERKVVSQSPFFRAKESFQMVPGLVPHHFEEVGRNVSVERLKVLILLYMIIVMCMLCYVWYISIYMYIYIYTHNIHVNHVSLLSPQPSKPDQWQWVQPWSRQVVRLQLADVLKRLEELEVTMHVSSAAKKTLGEKYLLIMLGDM